MGNKYPPGDPVLGVVFVEELPPEMMDANGTGVYRAPSKDAALKFLENRFPPLMCGLLVRTPEGDIAKDAFGDQEL